MNFFYTLFITNKKELL